VSIEPEVRNSHRVCA